MMLAFSWRMWWIKDGPKLTPFPSRVGFSVAAPWILGGSVKAIGQVMLYQFLGTGLKQLQLLKSCNTLSGSPGHHIKRWTTLRTTCWGGHVYALRSLVPAKSSCSFVPAKTPDMWVKPFWTFQTSPSASRTLMSSRS